jgi:DNA-binding protein YbaB
MFSREEKKEMLSTLLSKAVQKAQELPEAIQDELAEQFIEDIENEIKWQETLSKPQDRLILKELAQKAMTDSENGQTEEMGFDDL